MTTSELKKLQSEITQGEWIVSGYSVKPEKRSEPYIVIPAPNRQANGETLANAVAIALVPQLIAQNIELREALESMITSYEHHCPEAKEHSNAIKKAKAALAGEK